MEHLNRINEIQSRAKACGLRIDDLCAAVKVAPSTFYRWQNPDTANPRLRTLNRVLREMEAIIEEREKSQYDLLHAKYGSLA